MHKLTYRKETLFGGSLFYQLTNLVLLTFFVQFIFMFLFLFSFYFGCLAACLSPQVSSSGGCQRFTEEHKKLLGRLLLSSSSSPLQTYRTEATDISYIHFWVHTNRYMRTKLMWEPKTLAFKSPMLLHRSTFE